MKTASKWVGEASGPCPCSDDTRSKIDCPDCLESLFYQAQRDAWDSCAVSIDSSMRVNMISSRILHIEDPLYFQEAQEND
jgi:hypothetical protein